MGIDGWGIDDGWHDTVGRWHEISAATRAALRTAMGGDPDHDGPPPGRAVVVTRPGAATALDAPGRLRLEDGTDAGVVDALPPDLPVGIHDLESVDGGVAATVLAGPGRCHLPAELRTWGLAAQVPTSRSRASWGIGDLGDVRTLARWVASRGGGALALSPLHAATPVGDLPASPYSPSSRRWRHPLLLRVEEVPGAAGDPTVDAAARTARRLLDEPIVDRARAWDAKREALEHLWARLPDRERKRADDWRRAHGDALDGWARYCALAEQHGPGWTDWPSALRHPDTPAVTAAARALAPRVAFHAWLQLLLDDQLAAAAASAPEVRLIQDLAIGADPHGADAWLLQDLLALDISIGAPPDDFVPDGQVWGLPPFIPSRLRDAGYRPLAERLRAAMVHGGGLRVDHVMGLTRLFWVPGGDPHAGGYVRFAGHELLEVLALESARTGALVVGEDLGTVEEWLRPVLADAQVLSTRVVWFEDYPPEHYPPSSLGMVTTHDLPTIAGVWTGADTAELTDLGEPPPPDATAEVRDRLGRLVALPPDAAVRDVVVHAHRRLSEGASALVLGTLEDVAGVPHRPNVPGTTTERPANWSTALPLPIEELAEDPAAQEAIEALAAPRKPRPTG